MKLLVFILLIISSGYAQKIELLFMPAEVAKALKYKNGLKGSIKATNVLPMLNMQGPRLEAYLKSIADYKVILILGKGAAKAVARIKFPVPVVVINAPAVIETEKYQLTIYDEGYIGPPDKDQVQVPSPDKVPALKEGTRTVIKCHSAIFSAIVNAIKP